MRPSLIIITGIGVVLSSCQQAPTPLNPPSLQIVSPNYYSRTLRTLHYQVNHRNRRGRVVNRTYDIPVEVNRETGEIRVIREQNQAENNALDSAAKTLGRARKNAIK